MSVRYDLAVVGGGLVGACLAEELARGGARVLVLDAGTTPGHASARAAGVAVPPLRYAADREFFDWLNEAGGTLRSDIDRLGAAGHRDLTTPVPLLRLLDPGQLDAHTAGGGPSPGAPLTAAETAALLPGARLPDGHHVLRAEGLMVDGPAYLRAVCAAAVGAGVHWWQDAEVGLVEEGPPGSGVLVACADGRRAEADRVVLAAGAWTGLLSAGRVPVGPQRGQLAVLNGPVQPRCVLSSRLYLAPLPAGGTVVGATEEDVGFDLACTAAGIARLLAFAIRSLPALGSAPLRETRAGLRPVSGTGRPVVGRIPGSRRTYVASGHGGFGLLTARGTARGAAAGLLCADWDALPPAFCPTEGDACASTT
ncbi:NAD(P)/FAD-dependent oxidoreductase [Streptomyces litchfieldiae]|uniref:FAD-dependent oxidoreductase n=1 Tax=Streptomyces litchfieldiae TaxID=3075543 RepID=A0ABU2MQ53_9ACTN|nr:FAD-dependent oxidoreductase [Streptomyces sp. DSM 44938]MDT0343606.1 FAD-dependent oxidoreductase [Streptomyces sp. DSM 44938]